MLAISAAVVVSVPTIVLKYSGTSAAPAGETGAMARESSTPALPMIIATLRMMIS